MPKATRAKTESWIQQVSSHIPCHRVLFVMITIIVFQVSAANSNQVICLVCSDRSNHLLVLKTNCVASHATSVQHLHRVNWCVAMSAMVPSSSSSLGPGAVHADPQLAPQSPTYPSLLHSFGLDSPSRSMRSAGHPDDSDIRQTFTADSPQESVAIGDDERDLEGKG